MNKIRKIWVGRSIKNDSMSWEVGQRVRLNKEATEFGHIDGIYEEEGGYSIHIRQQEVVRMWKYTNMEVTVEFDLIF